MDHPLVIEKLKQMIKLSLNKNIALAAVVFDVEEDRMRATAEYWFNLGVKVMMVGTDKMFLSSMVSRALKAITPNSEVSQE